jgi:regulator of protease activity HflC (stomatin/prohibitin superfamily)
MAPALIAVLVLAAFVVVILARSLRIIPQARAAVVERLGRYQRTLEPGVHVLVPFADRVRAMIDLREQVVTFPPQPVITSDNLTVHIDTVVYFQVTEPRAATYAINNYIQAVEQLTITTLRNVVGSLNLEEALTSRDQINHRLRGVLDEATGKWGIRVARVELKAIDPPPSIQDAMEKQMRADRDKRAVILQAEGQRESSIKTAEGQKAAQILSAEGQKQAAILSAEAERQSRILRAEGERAARYLAAQGQAKAIETVFSSIHAADPDPKLLAYQYLQTLPQIAQGDANKVWIIPSEFSKALEGLSRLTGAEDGEATGSWLTEAGKGPANAPREPRETLDTSNWFDSNLPPAREQPEAQIRASDASEETRLAHQGLSFDSSAPTTKPPAEQEEEPESEGLRALPPTAPPPTTAGSPPYPTPAGQVHVPPHGHGHGQPPSGQGRPPYGQGQPPPYPPPAGYPPRQ